MFFYLIHDSYIALLGNKKTGVNSKTGNAEYLFYFQEIDQVKRPSDTCKISQEYAGNDGFGKLPSSFFLIMYTQN